MVKQYIFVQQLRKEDLCRIRLNPMKGISDYCQFDIECATVYSLLCHHCILLIETFIENCMTSTFMIHWCISSESLCYIGSDKIQYCFESEINITNAANFQKFIL